MNQTTGAAPGPACMDGIPRWASSPEAMQVEVMSSDTNSAQPSSSATASPATPATTGFPAAAASRGGAGV